MTPYKQRRLNELRSYVERAREMQGWTFDVQATRLDPDPPWSYRDRARELLAGSRSVLDMGTGGGEIFSGICEGYAGLAVATEEWPPNVPMAADRLSPQDVAVVHSSSLHLPFLDETFELVLNRHEELEPSEVAGALAPEGHLLTQQVDHNMWKEIVEFFPRAANNYGDLFGRYRYGFRSVGLTVTRAQTHDTSIAYGGLGDLVYMLAAVMPQWRAHDFDLEQDLDALLELERSLTTEEGIVLTESYFIIEAHKPTA